MVFYLSVFKILLRHHLMAYMSNLDLCFFDFLFFISKHRDSMASQLIDKSCLVLQSNDFSQKYTHLLLCDTAYAKKKNLQPDKI